LYSISSVVLLLSHRPVLWSSSLRRTLHLPVLYPAKKMISITTAERSVARDDHQNYCRWLNNLLTNISEFRWQYEPKAIVKAFPPLAEEGQKY